MRNPVNRPFVVLFLGAFYHSAFFVLYLATPFKINDAQVMCSGKNCRALVQS